MNGFSLMAESCRKIGDEARARNYDYLATCSDEDICALFDSSAFNEIAKSYMRQAVKELIDEDVIDEEQGRAIRNRFSLLFDEKRANEIL